MLEITTIKNANITDNLTNELKDVISNINEAINDIKINSMKIGYNLKLIRDNSSMLVGSGYEDYIDFGIKTYGFKKSSIYNFTKLADMFLDGEGNLKFEKLSEYTASQLEAMTQLKPQQVEELTKNDEIRPTMSVKAIKEKVKEIRNEGKENKKTENQKKAENPKDNILYKLEIGYNSLGNPFIHFTDKNTENGEDLETKINKINVNDLDLIITRITSILNSQVNLIKEENKKYLEAVNNYRNEQKKGDK